MNRLIGIGILIGSLLSGWAWMQYQDFRNTVLTVPQGSMVFEVPRGATLASVARRLEEAGAIGNARYLHWYGR